jgi:tetratricopeptide (TPR) repeat protein
MSTTSTPKCGAEGCEKMIAALQQALDGSPDDLTLRYQLGICYSGVCRPHSLTSPEIALHHLRGTAGRTGEDSLFRARIIALRGVTYTRCSTLPVDARLSAAIQCYQEAAAIYYAQSRFADWARMQFNLGNAWCDVREDRHLDKWENAISHYEQALFFRTKEADPHGFAATLENLGSAYRERKQGDKSTNVRQAIHCYRRAAQVYRIGSAPGQWAALHNNLGNAYLSLPATDRKLETSLARKAIRHFDLALRVRTVAHSSLDYGITQLNRAQAYLRLGMADSPAALAESARSFREAHEALMKAMRPQEAGMAARGFDLAVQAVASSGSEAVLRQ